MLHSLGAMVGPAQPVYEMHYSFALIGCWRMDMPTEVYGRCHSGNACNCCYLSTSVSSGCQRIIHLMDRQLLILENRRCKLREVRLLGGPTSAGGKVRWVSNYSELFHGRMERQIILI